MLSSSWGPRNVGGVVTVPTSRSEPAELVVEVFCESKAKELGVLVREGRRRWTPPIGPFCSRQALNRLSDRDLHLANCANLCDLRLYWYINMKSEGLDLERKEKCDFNLVEFISRN